MRSNREFHPEWGYLTPTRGTVRIALVSAAIGAIASAAVVFSLVDGPVAEEQSVAARTLAPAEATATPASAPSQRVQLQVPAQATTPEANQAAATTPDTPIPASAASSESAASSTVQRPSNMGVLAEAPAVTDAPPAIEPAHDAAPPPKKKVKKHLTVSRWEELRQPPPFLRW